MIESDNENPKKLMMTRIGTLSFRRMGNANAEELEKFLELPREAWQDFRPIASADPGVDEERLRFKFEAVYTAAKEKNSAETRLPRLGGGSTDNEHKPSGEGVTPEIEEIKTKEPPSGATLTKISRKIVSPRVLAKANETFDLPDGYVVVHRILTKEEIQAYADASQALRRQEGGSSGDDEQGE
jgi:hypothetical protein